jgi:hypothetical protein
MSTIDLQLLERRRLLAFNTSFLGGVLRVVGGPDPVNITVTVSLDNFRITDAVPQSSVGAISLVGSGGADVLRIASNITRRTTLSGGNGNDTFVGGAGADVFIGGSGNDTVDYSARTGTFNISLDGSAAAA